MWTCPNCGRSFKRTNQSHYCGKAPASIEEYIARQEEGLQPALIRLHDCIRQAIPQAEERISWGMPTWKGNGNILHFAANRHDISVYAEEAAVLQFQKELTGIETYKGTIRLEPWQEMPLSLIAAIAKWNFAMDQAD